MGSPTQLSGWLNQDTVFEIGPVRAAATVSTVSTQVADSVESAAQQLGRKPPPGALIFDLEHWAFSPLSEQQHPLAAEESVARAAAQDPGTVLILAPALDLTTVFQTMGPKASAYLRLHLAGDAAMALARAHERGYVDVQAQSLELDPAAYGAFAKSAVQQVRAAAPGVAVLLGLSTSPSVGSPTLADLIADVNATRAYVRGYWLNVPKPGPHCPRCGPFNPALAAALLAALARPG
jgi:hypothetical protein